MKKLLFFAAAVALSATVFSCEKVENETPLSPEISVSGLSDEMSIQVGATGEEYSFSYEIANPVEGTELKAEASEDWIEGLEAKDGNVTFTVAANSEESERTATITLSYAGANNVEVSVIQAAYFAPVISVTGLSGNPPAISFGPEGGESSFSYTVENPAEGVELAASADADWISAVSTDAGSVSFTVGKNTTFENRTATITLTYTGAADVTVSVEQAAAPTPVITVVQEGPVAAEAAGGEYSFSYEVTNPVDGTQLSATASESWVDVTSTEEGTVAFTVEKNNTFASRTATITLTYTGAADVTVSVEQAAAPTPVITVAQEGPVAAEAAGGDYSFTYGVENPVDGSELSASTDAEWITAISTADATVTFTVAANETTEARSANITLSYTGAENVTVTVEQAAGEAAIQGPNVEITNLVVDNANDKVTYTAVPNEDTYKWFAVIIENNDQSVSAKTDQEIYDTWLKDYVSGPNTKSSKLTYYGRIGMVNASMKINGLDPTGSFILVIAAVDSNGNRSDVFRYEFTL